MIKTETKAWARPAWALLGSRGLGQLLLLGLAWAVTARGLG